MIRIVNQDALVQMFICALQEATVRSVEEQLGYTQEQIAKRNFNLTIGGIDFNQFTIDVKKKRVIMPKFLTLTNKHDGKVVDINMDLLESFAAADDQLGGTKLFSPVRGEETTDMRCYWRVEETPAQIREMLNTSTSVVNIVNSVPKKSPVTTPIEYEVDGIVVSEEDIIKAVRAQRGTLIKENRDSVRLDKLQKKLRYATKIDFYCAVRSEERLQYTASGFGIDWKDSLRDLIDSMRD